MATRIRVQCITTSSSSGAITHVGGTDSSGSNWKSTVGEVIRRIESGTHEYYVLRHGKETELEVVNATNGKYLRTKPDGSTGNNLSDLPPCSI